MGAEEEAIRERYIRRLQALAVVLMAPDFPEEFRAEPLRRTARAAVEDWLDARAA